MKRVIKIFIFIMCFYLICLNVNDLPVAAEDYFETDIQKVCQLKGSDSVLETEGCMILAAEDKIKVLAEGVEVVELEGVYISHRVNKQQVWLLIEINNNCYLYKTDLLSKKTEFIELLFDKVCDIEIDNQEIIIVGSHQKNCLIAKYTFALEYLNSYIYGGEGYEEFSRIRTINKSYYLVGIKDAHSIGSPFQEVGSQGEQKVFMVKVSEQGIVEKDIYFNHQGTKEVVDTFIFQKNHFYVRIIVDNYQYLYQLNESLQMVNSEKYEKNDLSLVVASMSNNFLIITSQPELLIFVKGKVLPLGIKGELKNAYLKDNVLEIYYYQDYYLHVMKVYQYNIRKKENIKINIFKADFDPNLDMNNLKELKIESYIHELDVKLNKIEPFFAKQISGEYQATFEILINSEKSDYIETSIIIDDYVNIYNQHIYPCGYALNFFGYGILDGKGIVSGHKVREQGEHTLIISDANGKLKTYLFTTVEDYYCQTEELKPTDYQVFKNQSLSLELIIDNPEELQEIFVDQKSIPFEVFENGATFQLPPYLESGEFFHTIEKVILNNQIIHLNQSFSVKVLKDAPHIQTTELNENNFTILSTIDDNDQSLKDITIEIMRNQELLKTYNTYLQDYQVVLDMVSSDNPYEINVSYVYDIGDGTLIKKPFFMTTLSLNQSNYQLLDFSFQNNAFTMKMNSYNDQIKYQSIKLGNVELKDKYQVTKNYVPLIVSLSLSGVILGGGIGYFLFKRKKHKNVSR